MPATGVGQVLVPSRLPIRYGQARQWRACNPHLLTLEGRGWHRCHQTVRPRCTGATNGDTLVPLEARPVFKSNGTL